MTEKNTYWLVDQTGKKALVTGAAERDRWVPLGWADADEPTGDEFVYARLEGVAEPGLFPAASFEEVWKPRGWVASAPPEPVSPFSGDQLLAPAVATPEPVAEKVANTTTKEKNSAEKSQ